MAGSVRRKPYQAAIRKSPQHKEAICQLSRQFVVALLPFLTPTLTVEAFHEMYLCCHEVNPHRINFSEKAAALIIQKRKSIAAENAALYRKPGNIQLDQMIWETSMRQSERIDLTGWDEWDK